MVFHLNHHLVQKNTFEPVSYTGCAKQSGGSKNRPNSVSFNNQTIDPGYGYVSGEYNELFLGSGYPEMTSTATTNSCKKGGTKQKRKTYRKKHNKYKKYKKTRGKKHMKTRAKTRAKTRV